MRNEWCHEFGNLLQPYINLHSQVIEVGPRNVAGSLRSDFSNRVKSWIGIDIIPGTGVDVLLDCTRITEYFPYESFDCVISTEVLGYCLDWRRALLEMTRVLRPGGFLLITARSPGFELHDYPAGYWRFTSVNMSDIFMPVSRIISLEDDMTLGFACGVGVIIQKLDHYDDLAFREHLANIHPATVELLSEADLNQQNSILFDQYSRLSLCADILSLLSQPGDTTLDVGCGPECLLGTFIENLRITYLDPIIETLPYHSVHQLPASIDTHMLQGKQFDHIVAIDVLEHIPKEKREEFLQRISSLAKKSIVLLFPSSDRADSLIVDNAVNKIFCDLFGHEYPWLHEHFSYELPSCNETVKLLKGMGWNVRTFAHGNATLLVNFLPLILMLWEIDSLKKYALLLSDLFNSTMKTLDACPPFYRECIIASATSSPPCLNDIFTQECQSLEGDSLTFYGLVSLELQKLIVEIEQDKKNLALRNAELLDKQRQEQVRVDELKKKIKREKEEMERRVMEISDWASGMKQRLDIIDRTPFLRNFIRVYELFFQKNLQEIVKAIARKILPTWALQRVKHYIRFKDTLRLRTSLRSNSGKVIFVFPIIPWSMRWQRPQQLLSRLSHKGYTIIYISMGLQPRGSLYEDMQSALDGVTYTKLHDNVFKIWLQCETPYNIYESCLQGGNLHNVSLGLFAAMKDLKIQNPIYFLQFPSWHTLTEHLMERYKGDVVFDCMDDHSGFENTKPEALYIEEKLLSEADLVLVSSDLLFNRAKAFNHNVMLVNNGTEFEHFHAAVPNGELDHLSDRPIIGYFGAIAEWFDVNLLTYCARARLEWNFVLIGSTVGCDVSPFSQLPNVHLLSEKKYATLPGYLAYFSVCTIPFKLIPLIMATNPVKFYEYLSDAKPVVSVALPELEPFAELCYLAQDQVDFLRKLDVAVAEEPDDALIAKRMEVARRNSWDARVETILSANLFKMRST